MSNQTKLLISILFIAAIILCVGLTKFYLDATKGSENTGKDTEISTIVRTYENGMQVFEGANGYYGVLGMDGTVLIEPEWMEILQVGQRMVIVSRRMNEQVVIGGIDYEENVILPFAYRSMEFVNEYCCIATVAKDGSCVIYDADIRPLFPYSWEHAAYDSGMLELERDQCQFAYYIAEERPLFRRAEMQCSIGTQSLTWNVANRMYLSELTPEDFLRINQCVTEYVDMLLENDFRDLERISEAKYLVGLSLHDSFNNYTFEDVRDFSFSYSDSEQKIYDFAFSIVCEQESETEDMEEIEEQEERPAVPAEQTVRMNLYFQRNTMNQLILVSAGMDFQGSSTAAGISVPADVE